MRSPSRPAASSRSAGRRRGTDRTKVSPRAPCRQRSLISCANGDAASSAGTKICPHDHARQRSAFEVAARCPRCDPRRLPFGQRTGPVTRSRHRAADAGYCGCGHRNRVIYLRLPPIILILVQPKNVTADQLLPTSPYWQQLAADPLRARGNAIIAWSAAQFSRNDWRPRVDSNHRPSA